jgi:hypothetical protein
MELKMNNMNNINPMGIMNQGFGAFMPTHAGDLPNQGLILLGIVKDTLSAGRCNERVRAIVNKFTRNNRCVQFEGRFFKPKAIKMVRKMENLLECVLHIFGREVTPTVTDVVVSDEELMESLIAGMSHISLSNNNDMAMD